MAKVTTLLKKGLGLSQTLFLYLEVGQISKMLKIMLHCGEL